MTASLLQLHLSRIRLNQGSHDIASLIGLQSHLNRIGLKQGSHGAKRPARCNKATPAVQEVIGGGSGAKSNWEGGGV